MLIGDLKPIRAFESLHVLQPTVLEERFHYDQEKGLHVAFLRAFRISPVWDLALDPSYRGCRSWISLPEPSADLQKEPVLSDQEQDGRRSLFLSGVRSHIE
jgi:hypothetical protein